MESREQMKELAEKIRADYSKQKLLDCGVPHDVVDSLRGYLYGLTMHGSTMWKILCREIVECLEPYRDAEGLEGLIELAERYAGASAKDKSPPGEGDPTPQEDVEQGGDGSPEADDDDVDLAENVVPEVKEEQQLSDDSEPQLTAESHCEVDDGGDPDKTEPDDEEDHPSGSDVCNPTSEQESIEFLKIADITVDKSIQPRLKLNSKVVKEYREAYKRGDQLPPVTVFQNLDGAWLADGFHRIAAAKKAGITEIEAEVTFGDERDAKLHAVGANATHGLKRSIECKRRAVGVLLADAEWSRWSDREIARRARVSHPFVKKMRDKIQNSVGLDGEESEALSGNVSTCSSARKVKRGNTEYTMDTSGIGGGMDDNDGAVDRAPDVDGSVDEIGVAGGSDGLSDHVDKEVAKAGQATAEVTPADPAVDDGRSGAVFTAVCRVFSDWVSRGKVDQKTAKKFLDQVEIELEAGWPGLYGQVKAFAQNGTKDLKAA